MIIACPNCGQTDAVQPVHGSVYGMGLSGHIPDGCWCPTGFLECERCVLATFEKSPDHTPECAANAERVRAAPDFDPAEGTSCIEGCNYFARSGIFHEPAPYVCTSNPVTRGELPEEWWLKEPWKSIAYGQQAEA
jgi:hypothetical protein